ncbi:hypothetical protein ACQKQC_18490 [Vibrio fortis]|uniref:hypothetical protein n=1 Tax=Vibrio fortis TaxID=212667 RepID=UPI004068446E
MISVTKFKPEITLSAKQIDKIRTQHTKSVKVGNELKEIEFCGCCGNPIAEDGSYLEPLNGVLTNTIVVCSVCYMARNLDRITTRDAGMMIYAPDLTQEQVNAIAYILYFIKNQSNQNEDYLDLVADVEGLMYKRGDILTTLVCQGADVPSLLCQYLYMLTNSEFESHKEILSEIKLFPSEVVVSRQLKFLSTNKLKKFESKRWISMLQQINQNNTTKDGD